MPSSRQRATSSGWPAEVSITISVRADPGPRRMRSARVKPSMPGMWASSSTSGNALPAAAARPRAASAASPPSTADGRIPQLPSTSSRMRRLVALSSTTSTGRSRSRSGRAADGRATGPSARPNRAVKWKVLPLPTVLSTQIRPPIICTSCEEMARPRPVPPYLRVVEASAWEKASKISRCFSARCRCRCRAPRNARMTSARRRDVAETPAVLLVR